jgi:topoisomerase-4 subunit A
MKEKRKDRKTEVINLEEFIAIKGEKALGNKLTSKKIKEINLLEPLPYIEVIPIEEKVVFEVTEQVFVPELTEEIIVGITSEIELNITNESVEQLKPEAKDDNETEGQITLEL